MRSFLVALAGFLLITTSAQAKVAITVDKDSQQMTVEVDGVARYRWPVSSGLPSYETPNGSFRTFRMEADHYSKEFDDAPMPHSIFFTKAGHAIHGTDSVNRLGSPAAVTTRIIVGSSVSTRLIATARKPTVSTILKAICSSTSMIEGSARSAWPISSTSLSSPARCSSTRSLGDC